MKFTLSLRVWLYRRHILESPVGGHVFIFSFKDPFIWFHAAFLFFLFTLFFYLDKLSKRFRPLLPHTPRSSTGSHINAIFPRYHGDRGPAPFVCWIGCHDDSGPQQRKAKDTHTQSLCEGTWLDEDWGTWPWAVFWNMAASVLLGQK